MLTTVDTDVNPDSGNFFVGNWNKGAGLYTTNGNLTVQTGGTVNVGQHLIVSRIADAVGSVDVEDGGVINVTGELRFSYNSPEASTINVAGEISSVGNFRLGGGNNAGQGTLNIFGNGVVNANEGEVGTGSVINLTGNGRLTMANTNAANPGGLFEQWANDGKLTGNGMVGLENLNIFTADGLAQVTALSVADALQHIYLQPVGNQLVNADGVQLYARSSSGLPVSLFVDEGPSGAIVDEATHLFTSGSDPGIVTVRASQPGGELSGLTYAPAKAVYATFSVVDASDPAAPLSFAQWQAVNALAGSGAEDADSDGATDFEEFVMNTDPNDAADRPQYGFGADGVDGEGFVFQLTFSGRAQFRMRLFENDDLSNEGNWSEVVPKVLESGSSDPGERPTRTLRLQVPRDGAQKFWRFVFE